MVNHELNHDKTDRSLRLPPNHLSPRQRRLSSLKIISNSALSERLEKEGFTS